MKVAGISRGRSRRHSFEGWVNSFEGWVNSLHVIPANSCPAPNVVPPPHNPSPHTHSPMAPCPYPPAPSHSLPRGPRPPPHPQCIIILTHAKNLILYNNQFVSLTGRYSEKFNLEIFPEILNMVSVEFWKLVQVTELSSFVAIFSDCFHIAGSQLQQMG